MGHELGKLFDELRNEYVYLQWKWMEYLALFGSKPERVDLLNGAAPSFFRLVQDSLWEGVLLHIARLTDRSAPGKAKDNLTLQKLPDMVDASLRAAVDNALQNCIVKCDFARDWRNRHIAHRDLHLVMGAAKPLTPASRRAVHDAIGSIAALFNAITLHYLGSTVAYELTIEPLGNSENLLNVLRDGLRAEARRQDRLKSGKLDPEDLRHEPV